MAFYRDKRVERIKELLKNVSYKDDHDFAAYDAEDGVLIILTKRGVKDASVKHYRYDSPIDITFQTEIPYNVTAQELWSKMYEMAVEIEIHEVKEWFKINGKYFINPHPDN